uniref:Putative secreted protein n=1 Tax=Anopheles triannulatus TaxID=58253 RepID=A0A2M4B448_9DIPT
MPKMSLPPSPSTSPHPLLRRLLLRLLLLLTQQQQQQQQQLVLSLFPTFAAQPATDDVVVAAPQTIGE